jgi:hypothetical protein
LPAAVFEAGYSKDQELEADREGTQMAVAAGYSATGAIRMFELFQRMEEATHHKAGNPGEELSDVAQQTLEGYFRSHPLPSERITQIKNLIATQAWPVRAERDLAVAYVFSSQRAQDLFDLHKYAEAQSTALRTLKMQPNLQSALEVLAKAQFAQADFSGAAATYRELLSIDVGERPAKLYAIALAAADKATAAAEFDRTFTSLPHSERDLRATKAGLALLAGNRDPAQSLIGTLYQNRDAYPPELFQELGWWYYWAENYATSARLLEDAIQQRPGETQWRTDRAWAQIQTQNLADALQLLGDNYTSAQPSPERSMARAVAFWLSEQRNPAMGEFATAVAAQPEWKNAHWVKALYSPLVADTVQQMQVEQQQRIKRQQAMLNRNRQ